MKFYRKKPVVIEAMQWMGNNLEELRRFAPEALRPQSMGIVTPEGVMTISEGDWVIKGVEGEFYPCKPSVFEASYDEVSGSHRCRICQCIVSSDEWEPENDGMCSTCF